MGTMKFEREGREAVTYRSHADPQSLNPKLNRGGCMLAAYTHQENEEGCTHDSSGLRVDVPLLAEESPERLRGGSSQQSLQNANQDISFAGFGDGEVDALSPQNALQEAPNSGILEGFGRRFEDVFADTAGMMNFGEIKNFYMRRHKRANQCRVSTEGLINDQKPFVAVETIDRNPCGEQTDDKDMCVDNASSTADDKNFCVVNKKPASPSLEQEKKSTSQAKNTARWAREVMQLVKSGPFNEESTEMDMRDSSNISRKRRRLQTTNNCIGNESGELVMKERLATKNALMLQAQRKWRDVDISTTDPSLLIGSRCKVFWPEDKVWYTGFINGYNSEAGLHHVHYDDGDSEDLNISKELIKFHLSDADMTAQKLLEISELKKLDFQELAALATYCEEFEEKFRHGDLVWAKMKGHPMWPAFVIDEKQADGRRLDAPVHESTLAVQFFGSYDYAKIHVKNALLFSKGVHLRFHGKCKKAPFYQSLKEVVRYLKEGKLPDLMSKLQEDALYPTKNPFQMDLKEDDQDFMGDERARKTKKSVESLYSCPIDLGDLQVLSLGKIVRDSEFFHTENQIWTEGYNAVRKFPSIKDPQKCVEYNMEIMKDPHDRTKPLFCVTSADGEVVEGSSPLICWKKIYQKLDKAKDKVWPSGYQKRQHSGDSMFGFTNPEILKLIQALPSARACNKFTGWFDKRAIENSEQLLPAGFLPIEVDWKHADRCSVCDLDEDYTNNLFLQCDKCRILVHMHCYGESEPPNGHLWLCQLCSKGVSAQNSLCCLCPVLGGAMKRTTDGRWAHLTCAMWIPETCFIDVKHMEPIDGLKSIQKERWKLTCSICKVPYGVCIQCSDPSCCIAYHVLCARSYGYVLEVLEDSSHESRDGVEDMDDNVQFLSFCKRHRQSSKTERDPLAQQIALLTQESGYCPPMNISGCARTEPYDAAKRRGRQEPEVRAAASAKQLYVEKIPYSLRGMCCQDRRRLDVARKFELYSSQARSKQFRKVSLRSEDSKTTTTKGDEKEANSVTAEKVSYIFSVADRYQQMCQSLKNRLTFGKSAIHGWGVFTKASHRAGDMVIEYAGEVVRPIVADLRERSIYNTLVGAGTYMFRIDDERVVDATREGSIAHLINHSCEPNCFSRVVTVSGEEHIIIFAKRDIEKGEELSYDYRFTSKGEQLECFCGSPSCRGFVNVNDDEEASKILVPRCEVMAWTPSASCFKPTIEKS